MTLEQAIAIKSMSCWGRQGGLLSASEMVELERIVTEHGGNKFEQHAGLEVGHYNGLSTLVLAYSCDSLTSIDAHIKDGCVQDSSVEEYLKNMGKEHRNRYVQSLIMRSEAIESLHGFNFVFYDGDHGQEQRRFTELVHASPNVKLFIFDDKDFEVPAQCCEYLLANGWTDQSPPTQRLNGDKSNPLTMTLGVFTR